MTSDGLLGSHVGEFFVLLLAQYCKKSAKIDVRFVGIEDVHVCLSV